MSVATSNLIECPNCHNANEYGDYEGPTCEICRGLGFVSPAKEVRCFGCGSPWTNEDLAAAKRGNPGILSCCPERNPLDIDGWRSLALKLERETHKLPSHQETMDGLNSLTIRKSCNWGGVDPVIEQLEMARAELVGLDMLRKMADRQRGPGLPPKPIIRPTGSNADEWNCFLSEHLNSTSFLAVQIAEAIEDAERRGAAQAAPHSQRNSSGG